MKNFGQTTVKRSKDCAGFKWSVRWENGGDKSEFTVGIQKYYRIKKAL